MQVNLGTNQVLVEHDQAMIERAVQNLLSNAVKFSPVGGLVQLSVVADQTTASVHVQDDGQGIPESEQPYIFDRFYRGRSSVGEGSGLGLAITREIAAIHGGAITFTSHAGQGSHFILKLPLQ